MSKTRTCKSCKQQLPLDDYPVRDGYRATVCVTCYRRQRNSHYSSTPESYLRVIINSAKHQATAGKRRKDWSFTVEQGMELWDKQKGKCALSGVLMTYARDGQGSKDFNLSLDRIDPTVGYIPGNVQLVAYRVNLMKHTLTEDIFFWWIRNLHNFSCL